MNLLPIKTTLMRCWLILVCKALEVLHNTVIHPFIPLLPRKVVDWAHDGSWALYDRAVTRLENHQLKGGKYE